MENRTKSDNEIFEGAARLYSQKTENAWASVREKALLTQRSNRTVFWGNGAYGTLLRVAALFLLLAGLGWGIHVWINSRAQWVRTGWNQQKVQLPDGSVVFLNGNSSISFPKHFKETIRRVQLHGEAFFQVKKKAGQTFVVKVTEGEITVHGTAFNVRSRTKNRSVEVFVQSGTVGLLSGRKGYPELILHSGEFGILRQGEAVSAKPPGTNYMAWHTKVLRFHNEKLGHVVEVINRTYAKNIVLPADSLRDLRLTSTYNRVDFETVLRSVCLTFHLNSHKSGDRIILTPIK